LIGRQPADLDGSVDICQRDLQQPRLTFAATAVVTNAKSAASSRAPGKNEAAGGRLVPTSVRRR
jgi:hypothetical protein